MASSFTRSLSIALTLLIAKQINGFVINRDETTIHPDLFSDESVLQQVKNDMKRPNDIQSTKNDDKPVNKFKDTPDMVSMIDVALTTLFDSIENNSTEQNGVTETVPSTTYELVLENSNNESINKTEVSTDQFLFNTTNTVATDLIVESKQDLTTVTDQIATDTENEQRITTEENKLINTESIETMNVFVNENNNETTTSEVTATNQENIKTDNEFTTESINTISVFDGTEYDISPVPKNYVTIERKRVTSPVDIIKLDEDNNVTQTLPTIENFKGDLTNSHSTPDTEIISNPMEMQPAQTDIVGPDNQEIFDKPTDIETKSINTVDTMRAGFLNHSRTNDESTTVATEDVLTENEREQTKPISNESQNKLTEDAIKEELLREELMKNEDVNKYRSEARNASQDTRFQEDGLSVQPISQDRRTTLYSISTNYKPMKKIEVQPPKPFVRDPDDNSWRNESISSLGIVFKPKNASKSFKEVLKNKTEIEFQNLQEKENKDEVIDLRVRLEKIAEERKSKKSKIWKSGEIYNDSEENDGSTSTVPNTTESTTTMVSADNIDFHKQNKFNKENFFKNNGADFPTSKPRKFFDANEYYESTDDYDEDYVTLPNIDLKKFTRQFDPRTSTVLVTPTLARIGARKFNERKPTVQYFPPRKVTTTLPITRGPTTLKVNFNEYDDDFNKKVNMYETEAPFIFTTTPEPVATDRPTSFAGFVTEYDDKDYEVTKTPPYETTKPHAAYNYNRGTYVIKHYKDFLGDAAKDLDYDSKMPDYVPITRTPIEPTRMPGGGKPDDEYEDYEVRFRQEVVERFVDNFNQNSERFKVDFPVIYNNSVVHGGGRGAASSSALMKRVLPGGGDLAPAYELHYYVPEQEEQQPARDTGYHSRL